MPRMKRNQRKTKKRQGSRPRTEHHQVGPKIEQPVQGIDVPNVGPEVHPCRSESAMERIVPQGIFLATFHIYPFLNWEFLGPQS